MEEKSPCTFEMVWDDFSNHEWDGDTKMLLYSGYLEHCFVHRNIPTVPDLRNYLQCYVDLFSGASNKK